MRELVIMERETYRELKRKAERAEMLEAELKDMARVAEALLVEKKNKEKEETYHYIYVG